MEAFAPLKIRKKKRFPQEEQKEVPDIVHADLEQQPSILNGTIREDEPLQPQHQAPETSPPHRESPDKNRQERPTKRSHARKKRHTEARPIIKASSIS